VIRLDSTNTVKSLRDQLQILVSSGNDDSGFPILRNDNHDNGTEMIGMRMVGYIGANELEHALSAEFYQGKLAEGATNPYSFYFHLWLIV
jgi:chloride channel 3/4/5